MSPLWLDQGRHMAIVIGCPCGQNFDVEELELLVTLPCPSCGRELQLELDDAQAGRRRGIMTIREGPHGAGEQLVMPVGVPLLIGRGPGVWLPLDDERVEPSHCSILIKHDGPIILEDLGTAGGTWAGQHRLMRAKLPPGQVFRVGPFLLEVAVKPIEVAPARPIAAMEDDEEEGLPALSRVTPTGFARRLISNRFPIARWMINISAWVFAVYHFLAMLLDHTPAWPRWQASLLAVIILAVLLPCGRHVTLAHPYLRYTPLVILVALAVFDLVVSRPAPVVSEILLAGSVTLFVGGSQTSAMAILAGLLGTASVIISFGAALRLTMLLVAG